VATEMALNVLAYNMKRVMAIIGVAALLEALAASFKSMRADAPGCVWGGQGAGSVQIGAP
jgi:hypothetical protein